MRAKSATELVPLCCSLTSRGKRTCSDQTVVCILIGVGKRLITHASDLLHQVSCG